MPEHFFSYIRNPMTIIALFVGLSELGLGLGGSKLPESLQAPYVWAMIVFPFVCLLGFFGILIWRPQNFYGPSDFRSDQSYLAMNRRIADVEEYARLIDQKLESTPLYQYPRLSKWAKVIFLRIYNSKTGIRTRSDVAILDELRAVGVSEADLETAIQELVDQKWIDRRGRCIVATPVGQQAYDSVSYFVYARYGSP